MFQRVLIANRGEIAVRIARACREMGISPIAVYSEADRAALHVRVSDRAVCIGPPPSPQSYLSIDRIVEAALRTGADAVHPGYGFLSENPVFAEAVESAGLVFIGPAAAAMRVMGSKTTARDAAQKAGASVVPGSPVLSGVDQAILQAAEIGYPVMLKASAGGGGKGMRLIRSAGDLPEAFSLASSEAQAAFGDPSLYIEKLIEAPRHVEIQVLGDQHGNMVYLGERECSLQRRHQKVLEECPSPVVDDSLRRHMGEAAVNIARAAGYYNAGTVEFLLDRDKRFYFLEMNTRLQVEHPVTELVVGRDLVHDQIRIAAGDALGFKQEQVTLRGAAIECRIYAEDPDQNFMPSPGVITGIDLPAGPGVRDDSGIYAGWEVPIDYDPLLSKLAVWAPTRAEAIQRMARALAEYSIRGVRTNIGFFRKIVFDENFVAGNLDTGFLTRWLDEGHLMNDQPAEGEAQNGDGAHLDLPEIAAIAAALHFRRESSGVRPVERSSANRRWKTFGEGLMLD